MPDITFLAQRRLDEARSSHKENIVGTVLGGIIMSIAAIALVFSIAALHDYPDRDRMRDVYMGVCWITGIVMAVNGMWFICSSCDLPRTKRDIRRKQWDLADSFDGEDPTPLYPERVSGW